MTGTRLNDCTPTPDEQAKYDTEIKDEAQIRECMARDVFLAVDQRTLLRLLDEARAEIARLRTLRDEWEGRWLALKTERHGERDREGAMRAAIRNYNDADEEIIRVKREARVAAIEEAATVIEEHWIGTTGRLETTRDCLDLSDVQETIRALAAAPPEADVMELAREMMEHDLGDVEYIARALTTYGDQRAREGAMRAAIRNYNDSDEEIIRARREAHVAAIEAVKEALIPTPDTLTNEWAFGWEHARDKALLALHALAAAPPQSADTQE